MKERRIACIYLPEFPLELYGKLRPALRERPVALVDENSETAAISACNDHAAGFAVTIGMTAAQGNSLCPGLVIGVRELERERAVLQRVYRALKTVGPDIEMADSAMLFIEASRVQKLYGDEPGIARKLLAVLRPFGYPVKIGFAVNKFVARAAARHAEVNRWIVVPSGSEGDWLRRRQVGQLALSEDTAEVLFDLGIATVGQAAALPANEVVGRFGTEGAALTRRARGDDPELFVPERPREEYREKIVLDFPIHSTGRILMQAERLLERLLEQLRGTGRGAREAEVQLQLEDRTERRFSVAVERVAVTAAPYLRQLRTSLEQLRLEAPVREVAIRIPHTAMLLLEQTAFERPGANQALDSEAATTINRTLKGTNLCTAILSPAHLPERQVALAPVTSSTKRLLPAPVVSIASPLPYSLHRITGLRLLQPPQPADIRLKQQPGLEPQSEGVVRDQSGVHRVADKQGPWKLSGDWWQHGFDRLYYELGMEDKRKYLVFFDRRASRWFLHGVYD